MKKLPFKKAKIEEIISKFPTPFHLYDEKGILENVERLKSSFSWNPGFKEYFAVKATPNPFIMKVLKEKKLGMDCSSLAELILCEKIGVGGIDIMLTSNDTPKEDYQKASELGAVVNFDDITEINFFEKHVGSLPEIVSFRYNPGAARAGNSIIGIPEDAKYGLMKDQLFEAYRICKEKGVKRFGLHTMVASNELNPSYFVDTVNMLCDLVQEISTEIGIRFEFINMGGGIGIPYRPEDKAISFETLGQSIQTVFEEKIYSQGYGPLSLSMECGRCITGPYGYLITTAGHTKDIYKKYIGVDACMANLMRPGMYGAYHHISVLGKEDSPETEVYDVVGSLCENNDKFAIDRSLPKIDLGDILVIHDSGAHGHSMGFNYNGKLRSAEILLRADGAFTEIRRAETLDDLFATLDFSALETF